MSRRVALANTNIQVVATGDTPGSTVSYSIKDESNNVLSTAQALSGIPAYIMVPNYNGIATIHATDGFNTASKLLRIINANFGFGVRLGFHIHAREEEASLISNLLQGSTVGTAPPPEVVPPAPPPYQPPVPPPPSPLIPNLKRNIKRRQHR